MNLVQIFLQTIIRIDIKPIKGMSRRTNDNLVQFYMASYGVPAAENLAVYNCFQYLDINFQIRSLFCSSIFSGMCF